MPQDKLSVSYKEFYKEDIIELKKRCESNPDSQSEIVCKALHYYFNDDVFDSNKLKKYLILHPEDKARIREILDD